MNAYPNTPQAWNRTRRMARSVGVDLPRAVLDGWLTRRELDGLVRTCDACETLTCPSADAVPDRSGRCAHRSDLEALRL